MKSIGARLALWYAAASTATLACLFIVGYYLLRGYLVHGLDLLNQSEFEQITKLSKSLADDTLQAIQSRMEEAREARPSN